RKLMSPAWAPLVGAPNQLCLDRFAQAVSRLEEDVARRRHAAAEIRKAFRDLGAIRFLQAEAGCDTGAYFLSFTVAGGLLRNELLTDLHRRGLFLLRTWDVVPAFFERFSGAFPFGSSASVFLADHIGHIPVGRFIKAGPRQRL